MSDDNMLVLVEFEDEGGRIRRVADEEVDPTELAELSGRSREAVEKTLNTIGWIASRAKTLVSEAHGNPNEVELEFGIKITTKAGVIVMQGEGEFHIKAKITWKHDHA
jgi:hypothetical protein